jgi:hypothetical protein
MTHRFALSFLIAISNVLAVGQSADAQGGNALAGPGFAGQPVEAIAGQPFGVATLTIPIGRPESGLRVLVSDTGGRVLYPAITTEEIQVIPEPPPINRRRIGQGALINRLKDVIQNARDKTDPPEALRISFLFRGDEPFTVSLSGDMQQTFDVQPVVQPGAVPEPLLSQWWLQYGQQARRQLASGDYPPLVQTYLTGMLAMRLGLPPIDLREPKKVEKGEFDQPLSTLSLLAGTEELRNEIMRKSLMPPVSDIREQYPVPPVPQWQLPIPPPVPESLPIESMATAVPPECLYLRFGKFSNYLWFNQLSASRGGDFVQMAMMRGHNFEASKRVERLLNTKTNAVARLFGDSIINDMAIIGSDLYMQEGPSLGVLFEAKNAALLKSSLMRDRKAAAALFGETGSLDVVDLSGNNVSLLSKPDNSVRSYLVENGQFILLTTSQHLARRFLAIANGEPNLAMTPNFRYARLLLPVQNDYSVFGYFSPQFFQQLIGPQYQIELRRRLAAVAHIEMATLASMAAESEGFENASIEELIEFQFLPPWFNERADGSRTLKSGEDWLDSNRGRRGSFMPIADVQLESATAEELALYNEQAAFYEQNWQQTDPLVFGLRRFEIPEFPGEERIAIEAFIAPFGAKKLGWVSDMLAPPINTAIQLPPDDMVSYQVHLAGQQDFRKSYPNHVLFGGLKDMLPPQPGDDLGFLGTIQALRSTPGYVGSWPAAGYLDRLPLGLGGGRPDAYGFSRALIGMWRWQGDGISLLSFDRSIIENCLGYIRPVVADDPAQLRVRVGNIAQSQLASWVNTFWYRRGYETSIGNALLLDTMTQQLRIAPESALVAAEDLLDCKLQCPIGGQYELQTSAGQMPWWISTAWPAERRVDQLIPPPNYQASVLEWFRGGQIHLTQLTDKVVAVGQIDMQPMELPAESAVEGESSQLPAMDFNLFNLPKNIWGGSAAEVEKRKAF